MQNQPLLYRNVFYNVSACGPTEFYAGLKQQDSLKSHLTTNLSFSTHDYELPKT